jgi:hypothetical protein
MWMSRAAGFRASGFGQRAGGLWAAGNVDGTQVLYFYKLI